MTLYIHIHALYVCHYLYIQTYMYIYYLYVYLIGLHFLAATKTTGEAECGIENAPERTCH